MRSTSRNELPEREMLWYQEIRGSGDPSEATPMRISTKLDGSRVISPIIEHHSAQTSIAFFTNGPELLKWSQVSTDRAASIQV